MNNFEFISTLFILIGIGILVAPIIMVCIIMLHDYLFSNRMSDEEFNEQLQKLQQLEKGRMELVEKKRLAKLMKRGE